LWHLNSWFLNLSLSKENIDKGFNEVFIFLAKFFHLFKLVEQPQYHYRCHSPPWSKSVSCAIEMPTLSTMRSASSPFLKVSFELSSTESYLVNQTEDLQADVDKFHPLG